MGDKYKLQDYKQNLRYDFNGLELHDDCPHEIVMAMFDLSNLMGFNQIDGD